MVLDQPGPWRERESAVPPLQRERGEKGNQYRTFRKECFWPQSGEAEKEREPEFLNRREIRKERRENFRNVSSIILVSK